MDVETRCHKGDETNKALLFTAGLLIAFTLVKPLAQVPYLGTVLITLLVFSQLYIPLWRADKGRISERSIGLHLGSWRHDLKLVLVLSMVLFPPYIILHHLYMTHFHGWAVWLEWHSLLRYLPQRTFNPHWPNSLSGWWISTMWFGQLILTHGIGVALPEETFFRGYLLPQLQKRWPPSSLYFGIAVGKAALIGSALFALGHFLGEWNPLRLGPFFPALLFSWQRNATRSIVGAITFHTLCNLLGEILFSLYQSG